jgi:hypothetical protein
MGFLSDKAIHIAAVVIATSSILQKLLPQYPKFMLLFNAEESEKLPGYHGCEH